MEGTPTPEERPRFKPGKPDAQSIAERYWTGSQYELGEDRLIENFNLQALDMSKLSSQQKDVVERLGTKEFVKINIDGAPYVILHALISGFLIVENPPEIVPADYMGKPKDSVAPKLPYREDTRLSDDLKYLK